jgi:hypothetical protein
MTILFKNRPEFRCIPLTAWKIDGLGLIGPESAYLIDPQELKPVEFVWMGCPPHRKIHVALGPVPSGTGLGRPSEVLNPESEFLSGPPPRWSWTQLNLDGAIIYWHLFCFPKHSGFRSKPGLLLPACL